MLEDETALDEDVPDDDEVATELEELAWPEEPEVPEEDEEDVDDDDDVLKACSGC